MFKLLTVLCIFFYVSYGMDCSYGTSENVLEELIHSCPRPLIDTSDEKYCCPKSDGSVKCCNLSNFIFDWLAVIWPIILLVLVVIFILSCLCCCLRQIRGLC